MSKVLVIGIIVVLLVVVGYLVTQNFQQKSSGSIPTAYQASQNSVPTTQPTSNTDGVTTNTIAGKGQIFTDAKGMTIYTYDKDTKDKSNCTGQCLVNWPPFVTTSASPTLPDGFSTFKNDAGSMQYAFQGMPLYYYIKDKNPGDITGDGVGGVWHLVLNQSSAPTSAPAQPTSGY